VTGVVYDAGALVAADRRIHRFLDFHDQVVEGGVRPLVPVVVLAQAWRGGPQPSLSRVLKGCDIRPDDERVGRAAGAACVSAGTRDVVDSVVVVTAAAATSALVVTSDVDDLQRLADAIGVKLHYFAV
jgi:hypothetical protein